MGIDEFANAGKDATAPLVLSPISKDLLDQRWKRRACGRVLEVKAGELFEPPTDLRSLVR